MHLLMAIIILLTKTTAAENEAALSYHRVRGLYFQAVVFVAIIDTAAKNIPLIYSIVIARYI